MTALHCATTSGERPPCLDPPPPPAGQVDGFGYDNSLALSAAFTRTCEYQSELWVAHRGGQSESKETKETRLRVEQSLQHGPAPREATEVPSAAP
jgi:hypothetical protein